MAPCLPYNHSSYKWEDDSMIGSLKKLRVQWGCTKRRKMMSRKMNVKLNNKRAVEEHDKLNSLQLMNQKTNDQKDIKLNERCELAEELVIDLC